MLSLRKKILILASIILNFQSLHTKNPLCISLGSSCGPAINLRILNIRTEAYPFDWITSPFDALYSALQDDFKYFFTDLTMLPNNIGVADHYGFSFTHDLPTINEPNIDPLNTDVVGCNCLLKGWEQVVPAVKEKYRRRIERLQKVCLGKEKVFFLRSEDTTQEQAIQLRDLIAYKYPTLNFILVVGGSSTHLIQPWNIDKIKNFYLPQWDKPAVWLNFLKQVDPVAFRRVTIPRFTHDLFAEHSGCNHIKCDHDTI